MEGMWLWEASLGVKLKETEDEEVLVFLSVAGSDSESIQRFLSCSGQRLFLSPLLPLSQRV